MKTKPMTLRQFFERLPKDGWELQERRFIRRPRGTVCECPVTSLANKHAGHVRTVGEELGLDSRLCARIANAADRVCMVSAATTRIRRLLLKHCGLTEPTT